MTKCSEVRALLHHGWYVERQSGSHVILKHPDKNSFISFPNHGTAENGKRLNEENPETSWIEETVSEIRNRKQNERRDG